MRSRAFQQGWVCRLTTHAWVTSGLLLRFPCKGGLGLSHRNTSLPFIPAELNRGSHAASPLKYFGGTRIISMSGKTEIFSTHSQFPKNYIIKPGHLFLLLFVFSYPLCSALSWGAAAPQSSLLFQECSAVSY